jgi:protein-S-isoprenylcysteine O-methyltransferase Ste14
MLSEATTTYLLFGSLVSTAGLAMIVLHVMQRRNHLDDETLSESDRRFYGHQYSRRMQTSALTVTLGALIGLCGYIPALAKSPVFATCYVLGLLLLSLSLILLAMSDAIASRVHSGRVNRRQQKMRESLQEALMELKSVNDISLS